MPDEPAPSASSRKKDDFFARILDALVDLLETARDWLRQEAEATVREKIVLPLQRLGLTVASAVAAALLLVVGLIFVAVAAVIALGNLIGSGVFLAVKVRSMQR